MLVVYNDIYTNIRSHNFQQQVLSFTLKLSKAKIFWLYSILDGDMIHYSCESAAIRSNSLNYFLDMVTLTHSKYSLIDITYIP